MYIDNENKLYGGDTHKNCDKLFHPGIMEIWMYL